MKISIITVCLNSEKTILANFNSILSQSYKNIEHIIVDGGSNDNTFKYISNYPNPNKKIFIIKKRGIYNAMNVGIKNATGNFIGILNSDDILNSNLTIETIVKKIKKNPKHKIFLGNIIYFKKVYKKVERYYTATKFHKNKLKGGFMPPHPGSFIHKDIYRKVGLYNEKFTIAGDFDFFVKCFLIYNIKFKIMNLITTRMRIGGISTKNIFSNINSSFEIYNSLKDYGINSSFYKILLRLPLKLDQYLFFNKKLINQNFSFKIVGYYRNIFCKFNIIKNINLLKQNQNFVLSALNLAFLGYYFKGDIILYKNLINWPDGTFSKTVNYNLKKIAGREILRNLDIDKRYINQLTIIGNLSDFSKKYLSSKYQLPIKHINLPYGSINVITKKLKKITIRKKQLILITLPTPKQEQLARYLFLKNKYYKIICIGASISIASGEEKEVPEYFKNFEFAWRLRYEPRRRLIRLISSFIHYIKGVFIKNDLDNVQVKIQK